MRTETLLQLAQDELRQLQEEGRDTTPVAALLREAEGAGDEQLRTLLEEFFAISRELPRVSTWPYDEPSGLDEIRDSRPDGPRRLCQQLPQGLADRVLGAWIGRCAGCMLGKPVEGRSKDQIAAILTAAGEEELGDYFPPLPEDVPAAAYLAQSKNLLRGGITVSIRDDDTDYTILGIHTLEECGHDFEPIDVAMQWLNHLPYFRVYTAERAAYRNFVDEIWPPESAFHLNPYREWIGAQIRADAWGYAAPGWPEKAAELAWRDACISHTGNGIYGEMFFAALISAALVVDDLVEAIWAAAAEVPRRSRFYEMVHDCLEWCRQDGDWQQTWRRINDKYGQYHPVHTLNNAALVLMGLLHSGGDFTRAVGMAVMGGWDTDCNGATAGSVMGAILGASRIPKHWSEPLNDTLESSLEGMNVNRISELAQKTLRVSEQLLGA